MKKCAIRKTVDTVKRKNTYLLKIGFVFVQKIYIKFRNFKDGLCLKLVCPFCVQKKVMNTS